MFIKTIVYLLTFCLVSATNNSPEENERPGWPGYKYYPEIQGWLKLHTDIADWHTARMNCHDEDAILAAPMDDKMASILMAMAYNDNDDVIDVLEDSYSTSPEPEELQPPMPRPPSPVFYVGVQLSYPDGVYKTKNGKAMLSLDPTDLHLYRCSVYKKGIMVWEDCSRRRPYVCHASALLSEFNNCGDNSLGYEVDPRTGQCYKFHSQAVPWNTAHRTCLDEGAHLAIPNSDVEAQVLVDLFEKYPYEKLNGTNPAWGVMAIGFYYWKEADKYVTIFGQTIEEAGYAQWSSGNPSSRGKSKELGGGMFRYGLLDDVDKSQYAVPFICEKPSIKHTSLKTVS